MKTRSQIADYLDLLKMKYVWNEKGGFYELAFSERKDDLPASPEETDQEEYFRYTIRIGIGEKWVQIYADIYPIDKIPEEKRAAVFVDLLLCNRKYAEVCFDFDEEHGIIGTSQEQLIQGINFDVFREEFFAVPWAVKKFWSEIAKKHKLE